MIVALLAVVHLGAPPTAAEARALMNDAGRLVEDIEFEAALPLLERVLSAEDLDPSTELEAYLLRGQVYAAIGNSIEAEKAFRVVYRANPEVDLPQDTPPKIIGVWRKVQVEEGQALATLRKVQRRALIEGLALEGGPPDEPAGGRPLRFDYRLRDPTGAVDGLSVSYRRMGQDDFSQLPLVRNESGWWTGEVTGDWTTSDTDFTLEFFVESRDSVGTLLAMGSTERPVALQVAAGSPPTPAPLPAWAFWSSLGATLAAGVAAGVTSAFFVFEQEAFRAEAGAEFFSNGAQMVQHQQRGETYALAANIAWITTGVFALLTGVFLPFTDFGGDAP